MDSSPNILFVVLDTVRAKTLSLYGGELEVDNGLKNLANSGVLYDAAIAPSAWTLPSHASIFTGQYPSEHGAVSPDSVLSGSGSFPQKLSQYGYQTFGVSANPFVGPRNGFEDLFDEFEHVVPTPNTRLFEGGRDAQEIARVINETELRKILATGKRALRGKAPARTIGNLLWYKITLACSHRRRNHRQLLGGPEVTNSLISFFHRCNKPFLAFANFMEAHGPYRAPNKKIEAYFPSDIDIDPEEFELDPWAHILQVETHSNREIDAAHALYRAAISYLDDQIGELLNELEELGIRDNTIVMVTSDHGEAFGERGRLDHNCLYQPVTRVPLVIDHPEISHGRRADTVSLCSLYHTILHATGVEDLPTKSLLVNGQTTDHVVSQYLDLHIHNLERRFDRSRIEPFEERLQSVFGEKYQLLVGDEGTEELIPFDGSVNPVEGNDEVRNRLREEIPPFPTHSENTSQSGEGPDEELLRSLGYLE